MNLISAGCCNYHWIDCDKWIIYSDRSGKMKELQPVVRKVGENTNYRQYVIHANKGKGMVCFSVKRMKDRIAEVKLEQSRKIIGAKPKIAVLGK